jgi:hypothetical protein
MPATVVVDRCGLPRPSGGYAAAMATLYTGPATLTFPDGPTVNAHVELWREEHGPLVQWGGTAENDRPQSLWDGNQRLCTVKFGSDDAGYQVADAMVIEPDPGGGAERVTLRGSGEFNSQ